MKLEAGDLRLLSMLGTGPRPVEDLASDPAVLAEDLADRLAALADNGLVDDLGDGHYRRTESGRRVLVAEATGNFVLRNGGRIVCVIQKQDHLPREGDMAHRAPDQGSSADNNS